MSMRIKAALVIMAIVSVITAAYFLLSLSFTRQNIVKTMEQDLSLVIEIADDFVTTKINLLKSDANTIAERLLQTGSIEEMAELMVRQMEEFEDFISLTVYDREGIIANCGEPISHDVFLTENRYIQVAFNGEAIFSTTHYNNISGDFIVHVFVPMGHEWVLSATFPGMLFTDILSSYRLWRTGNIYMTDETGVIIANYRHEMVYDRYNFIEEAKTNPELQSTADFFQKMITSEGGVGSYTFDGDERLCKYEHLKGSRAGWRIAVAVPLSESPLVGLQKALLFSALCFLALGLLISIFISGIVARHFNKIEDQNRELEKLNKIARAASEAKSNFLASMSHEMRTPLNAIIGLSGLTLEAETLDGETVANLEKIYNAGETLLFTVNDILDISKIEAGKLEMVPAEYSTPSMINDTISQSIMRIGDKPIKFILNISENLPARLYGDELRVKQIINNLLSNAFKYTREGTVELNINCEQKPFPGETDVAWMTVRVSDTGKGIRPEDMDKLFGSYAQMDIKINHKIEGTGLGLSITKKMIDMMGGSITVESEYKKGSVFTARFRQKLVTDTVIGAEVVNSLKNFHYSDSKRSNSSRLLRINLSYARVLVVDDVGTNLDVAKGMMKPYKLQIDCVGSGPEAIDAIRAEKVRYNAVFMDHMMPGMDGIEAVRIIREEIGTEYAKTVPIIALTANAIVGNENLFLSKGFQAFLPKPIEILRLDTVLREWVRDKTIEETVVDAVMDTSAAKPESVIPFQVDGVDFNKGLERFSGDKESYIQVLRSFTANTPPLLESAKKVNTENLPDYAITVHGLKSSCRGICAENAGSAAEALEKAAKSGDFDFVIANNAAFIEMAEKLSGELSDMLRQMAPKEKKPKKDKPDNEILNKLLAASKALDIDGVDAAVAELETWDYESDNGLVAWLRENADQINFTEITEKLSALEGLDK